MHILQAREEEEAISVLAIKDTDYLLNPKGHRSSDTYVRLGIKHTKARFGPLFLHDI